MPFTTKPSARTLGQANHNHADALQTRRPDPLGAARFMVVEYKR
jgi:hypothetical protein